MNIGNLSIATQGPSVGPSLGGDGGGDMVSALSTAISSAIEPLRVSLESVVSLLSQIFAVDVKQQEILQKGIEKSEAASAEAGAEGARGSDFTGAAGSDMEKIGEFDKLKDALTNSTSGIIQSALLALGAALVFFKDETMAVINSVALPKIVDGLRKTFNFIAKPFRAIISVFTKVGKFFGRIGEAISDVVKSLSKGFMKFTGFIAKIAKAVLGLLGPFGAVLRALFFPVAVIMSTIDAIKGFVAGFKDGGILDGIFTAIGEVLGGLVGLPLDLLKKLVGFIGGLLGFDQFKEKLEKFSFKEMIVDFFGNIVDFFRDAFKGIMNKIEDIIRAIPGFGDSVADKFFGEKTEGDEARSRIKDLEKSQKDDRLALKREKAKAGGGDPEKIAKLESKIDSGERAIADNQLIVEKEDLANMSPEQRARLERQKKQKETADKITAAKKSVGLDPMAPGTTTIDMVDGKPVSIMKDGLKVDPKVSGDKLNLAGAAGGAIGGTNINAPTNVNAPNQSTTNVTSVKGGGQGSVEPNIHPTDPSSFRLESAQAQF